jgi:hypothetical protein
VPGRPGSNRNNSYFGGVMKIGLVLLLSYYG